MAARSMPSVCQKSDPEQREAFSSSVRPAIVASMSSSVMIAAWPAADAHRQMARGAEPWVRELSLLGRYPGRAPVGRGGIGQAVTVDGARAVRSARPVPPQCPMISAAIDTAVSSGVRAPMSSPIGEASRASSASVSPRSRSRSSRSSWVRRLPIAPTYAAGVRSAASSSGTSNFGSWVSTQMTVRASTSVVGQVLVRPFDDDLVGLREPLRRREHRPRVAHRDVVAEEPPDPGDRGREVDRPEHEHPRRRRERLHEHAELVAAPLAVGAVVQDAGRAVLEHAADVVGDGVVEPRASRACRPRGPATPPAWRRAARAVDDRRHGDRLAVADGRDDLGRAPGTSARDDRLDEDVDDAAAGEADGERVVVGDAVALQHRPSGGRHLLGEVVDRALDAAAATRCRPPRRRRPRPSRAGLARRRLPGRARRCARPNGAARTRTAGRTSSITSRIATSPVGQQLRQV